MLNTNMFLISILVFFSVVSTGVPWRKPSAEDIEKLQFLYKLTLDETKELTREVTIPINNEINFGRQNITQQKNASLGNILNFEPQNAECLRIYQVDVSLISPDLVLGCNQSNLFNATLNKFRSIQAHIVFCALSNDVQCVREIKEEIMQVKDENFKNTSEAPKLAQSCRMKKTDFAARAVEEAEHIFYVCVGLQA